MNIGALMDAANTMSARVDRPVAELRNIVSRMRADLTWYQQRYPDHKVDNKLQLLRSLEAVTQALEQCEPVDLMRTVRTKLTEAALNKFNPDVAVIYLPLKHQIPDILHCKPAIIDLCDWRVDSPYDYDHVGMHNGSLLTSNGED